MGNYSLEASMENGKLRFTVAGRIDSTNSKEFGDIIMAERKKHPRGDVVFDCAGLDYVSSAGLRALLALEKQETEPVRLVNVSQDVYDIFDITGFSQIFDVSKALRDVSDEETRKIGYSNGITVYYIGDETLMKVYPEGTSLEYIEQERRYAQAAFLCGVPTLIAYDVVTYHGQYGMLYELVKANTVSALLDAQPWKLNQYAEAMGRLLKTVHSSVPRKASLPRVTDICKKWARGMLSWLYHNEVDALLRLIDAVPEADTMLYGSFHTRNVFVHHGEPILINMAGICCGNPIYDLGTCFMIHRNESENLIKRMSGFEPVQAERFWNTMIGAYFSDDANAAGKYGESIRAAALLCSALYPAAYRASSGSDMPKDDVELFVAQARRDLFPAEEHIALLLRLAEF